MLPPRGRCLMDLSRKNNNNRLMCRAAMLKIESFRYEDGENGLISLRRIEGHWPRGV